MAITNTTSIETISQSDLDQIPSKLLLRRFGKRNDSIALTISDKNGNILLSDELFTDYSSFRDPSDNQISSIDIDYEQVLRDYGYRSGKYQLSFSFQRKLLTKGIRKQFYISDVSPSRTEIRVDSNVLTDVSLKNRILLLGDIFNTTAFVKDLNLSFGNGVTSLAINSIFDNITSTGVIKLYEQLPPGIGVNTPFRVYEEIINPLEVEIDLGSVDLPPVGIPLSGPNFNIDYTDNFTVPSGFRTYDAILNSGAITSSFNNIKNYLSSSIPVDLEFDNHNTPSGYHFENFIHYSSATERLKNFKYKLELLESYSGSLATLNNVSGSVTSSDPIIQNIEIYNSKTNQIIQGFDYYERYLYFEKGDYAWPKTTEAKPHINAKVNSAAAVSWFGAPIDSYEDEYYGGQMLSASKYDDCNPYYIGKTIPPDIKNNPQNEAYVLFTEMIAQHFDGIWAYIDSITDKYQAHSGLNDGISKELVFNALAERGIRAYSQFENSSIYEYFLGDDGKGSFQYETTDGSTMISASNAGSIPKGDISKEIWKRLYHNSSYLLKTKGTERGLKALIACYGIPESVLHVKEYGGPLQDKTGFRTFSYQKESRMIKANNLGSFGSDDSFLNISDGLYNGTDNIPVIKTIQTRILPDKAKDIIPLISVTNPGDHDLCLMISRSINNNAGSALTTGSINIQPSFASASFGKLIIVTGSAFTTSTTLGDGNKVIESTTSVPFYNGKVWNISLTFQSGSGNNVIQAFGTNTTQNKNTYVCKTNSITAESFFSASSTNVGLPHIIFGGNTALSFNVVNSTGSAFQEIRLWSELLTEKTITTQSLSPFNYNGNTISSSYEALQLRYPLGSDLNEIPGSGITTSNISISSSLINKTPNPNIFTFDTTTNAGDLHPGEEISIEETHHLPTPDTVGSGMVSDKVRIDNGTFDDNFLDPYISVETSPQDRQPLDYSDVGVFFSPSFEINEDIIYTLGGFRLDDYIGDPRDFTSGSYPNLKNIKDIYFQKVNKKYNFQDYIRTIQFFDHTLFKMIKDFTPAKANLKTGLVIEPHYLERAKFPGKNIDYEQKVEHLAAYTPTASLNESALENIPNVIINVPDYILSGSESTATENVAQTNLISRQLSLA
jgi:hypothetical protein